MRSEGALDESAPLPAIALRRVTLGYPVTGGVRPVLERASAEVPAGSFALFLGPSGAGKSSLLAAVAGLDDPYAPRLRLQGELTVLGERVRGALPRALRGRIGAVFQEGALVDELSPRANVLLAVRARGERASRADELLAAVELPHPPPQVAALSGGQRKRVAIARALAGTPDLLILDEPTAGLDARGAARTAALLRRLHERDAGRTTLVITHDLEAFREHADGALLLDARVGDLEWVDAVGLDDAIARARRREETPAGPPPLIPHPLRRRAFSHFSAGLAAAARPAALIAATIRHLAPLHLGMTERTVRDRLFAPALFIAISALTVGGLATRFALANNPLEGAFRHEVLLGVGKVLVAAALPLLAGVLFAAHTAAGATARLASLRRSRVFEALPTIGVRTEALLLTPLVWGACLGALAHTAQSLVFGNLAAVAAARLTLGLSDFASASACFAAVDGSDLRWAAGKALAGGLATALISYGAAASPKSSEADVASAADRALIGSTLAVLVIHGAAALFQFGPAT